IGAPSGRARNAGSASFAVSAPASSRSGRPLGPSTSATVPAACRTRTSRRSAPARVSEEADDEEHGAGNEPRQRIEVLVAAARGRRLPAGGAGTFALHPRDVDEQHADAAQQAERGAASLRARREQDAD